MSESESGAALADQTTGRLATFRASSAAPRRAPRPIPDPAQSPLARSLRCEYVGRSRPKWCWPSSGLDRSRAKCRHRLGGTAEVDDGFAVASRALPERAPTTKGSPRSIEPIPPRTSAALGRQWKPPRAAPGGLPRLACAPDNVTSRGRPNPTPGSSDVPDSVGPADSWPDSAQWCPWHRCSLTSPRRTSSVLPGESAVFKAPDGHKAPRKPKRSPENPFETGSGEIVMFDVNAGEHARADIPCRIG